MHEHGSPLSTGSRARWTGIRARAAGLFAAAGLIVALTGTSAAPTAAAAPVGVLPAAAGNRPLTNLAHLDFLTARVAPPHQAGHTTYQLGSEPALTTLWVYATAAGGHFTRVGGGTYDAASRTYGQGAFDADDMARAAVVYLEHWRQFGDTASRNHARELLRGVTYLQDASGPDAGNVVLWMQPDGTLHPSATPADTPDPSDSGASYWLARTIWALGVGYADFRSTDPAFAGFLAAREDLAIRALDRETLSRYPREVRVDGRRRPAWLITGGADASAEAVLGLAAYVDSGGGSPSAAGRVRARRALSELSDGIARMAGGDAWDWPFGAILPAVTSISEWHAWAGLAPAALAHASATLADPRYLRVAEGDAVTFTSHLIIQGGPDDSWAPAPVDTSQIAYGADGRVESLQALTDVTHEAADARLTGLAASWFFGNNPAGRAVYDPRTGVTADGISATGVVNPNSGAESTIHGLLTMLVLDRDPVAAAVATAATVTGRTTDHLVEAESGALSGNATVVTPVDPTTGESQWSGGAYVELRAGSRLTLKAAVPAGALLMAVTRFLRGSAATRWDVGDQPVGLVHQARIGARGASAWPGALEVSTLAPSGSGRTIGVTTAGPGSAAVDAVLVQPAIESLQLSGGQGESATTLVRSFARRSRTVDEAFSGHRRALVDVFDAAGVLRSSTTRSPRGGVVRVTVPAGGTVLLTRG